MSSEAKLVDDASVLPLPQRQRMTTAIASLLGRDLCTLERPDSGTDSEGFPLNTYSVVGPFRGTWGSPSSTDIQSAARMDQTVQAVCASRQQAQVGDKLVGLRGKDWIVTHVRATVVSYRHYLREA